jgi:nucleoside-diphosphate-sugar epimerase
MNVFVAGATGVIGRRLVPLLVEAGHDVAGMTRSPEKFELLRQLGAVPVVGDVFDRNALREALAGFGPDAVVGELTDLPDDRGELQSFRDRNDRMRREGMVNLLEAARAAKSPQPRFLAESIAWQLPGRHGEAVAGMERAVLNAGGVVLRYGQLYGPGTYYEDELPDPPRVHIEEAARRTAGLLDAESGVVTIVDA